MQLKNDLSDRVALVTAAAGAGIGQACVRLLAAAGADVVITDLAGGRAEQLAQAVAAETGRGTLGRELDVTDEAAVAGTVAAVLDRWGRIDILVNNAGMSDPAPLWETTTESWRQVVDICLTGTFFTMRAVLPHMIGRRSGAIVNITSTEAYSSRTPGNTAYHAGKSAVQALSRSTALQVAPHQVRINCVAPGLVPNPFLERMLPKEHLEEMAGEIPLGRVTTPEEIADAVLFLAADTASSITGETIAVCGGSYMRP